MKNVSKQGRNLKTRPMFEEVNTVGAVNTATTGVSVASASITTAGVSISIAEPRTPPTTTTTAFKDEDLTIAQTLVKMRKMAELERRQNDIPAKEEASKVAINQELDDIQARIKADEQMASRLQSEEQEQFTIKEMSRMLVEMIAKRKRQDLFDLHRLVMKRFESVALEGYDLILWGDLNIMIKPNEEDEVWRNQ
nr:hypothetical protein [Tanacetum cinerariifolium]